MSTPTLPERGASVRDVTDYWLSIGGAVSHVRRSGETEWTHPAIPGFRERANGRRKDAPLHLIHRIRKVAEQLTRPAPQPKPAVRSTTPEPKEAPVSQHEPYVRVETITPERAAALLGAMPNNRPLRQKVVQRYAREMLGGRWLLNGEGIKIGRSGFVIDGQHRLQAICLAKTPVRIQVTYEVDDSAKLTIDTGLARTFHDAGQIAGLEFSSNLPPVLRWWWLYECVAFMTSKTTPTHQELEAVRQAHPGVEESMHFIRRLSTVKKYMIPSVQAFVHSYVAEKVDREMADAFFQDLNDGADLPKTSPIYLLRRQLMEAVGTRGRRADPLHVLALTIKAWNAWVDGAKMMFLKYGANEEFPRFGKTSRSAKWVRAKRTQERENVA